MLAYASPVQMQAWALLSLSSSRHRPTTVQIEPDIHLREGRRETDEAPNSDRGPLGVWIARRLLWPLLKWCLILALPFVALLRGSLHAYQHHWPVWLAITAGFAAAFLVLFFYASWAYLSVKSEKTAYGLRTVRTKALVVLLGLSAFQGYVLLTPDSIHIKSSEATTEYATLHPLLRMSVGVFLLVDDSLLITDLSRHPSDYEAMGLSTNPRSLHYPQADGYVHAVDLRTKGHSLIRNALMRGYFSVLGFRTIRHVGTADHLHVALPLPAASR